MAAESGQKLTRKLTRKLKKSGQKSSRGMPLREAPGAALYMEDVCRHSGRRPEKCHSANVVSLNRGPDWGEIARLTKEMEDPGRAWYERRKAVPVEVSGLDPDPDKETRVREYRDYRHWLLWMAQKILYFADIEASMRGCGYGTFERWSTLDKARVARAELHMHPTGVSLVGVDRCGNPLCPVCGPRIAARRMRETEEVAKKMLAAGFTYLFPTFTCGHPANIPLKAFFKIHKKAWALFYKTKEYKWLSRHYGISFTITSMEVTDDDTYVVYDKRTGWHVHKHKIYFIDTGGRWLTETEIEEIRQKLLSAWKSSVEEAGLYCSDERGVYIQTIQHHAANKGLKIPFDKLPQAAQERYICQVSDYVAKGMGFEITGGQRKISKRGKFGNKRINGWNLLEAAVMGDKRGRERWLELFQACADEKMSTFRMSQGLRDFSGIKEVSDEEAVKGEAAEPLIVFDSDFVPKKGVRKLPAAYLAAVRDQARVGHLLSEASAVAAEAHSSGRDFKEDIFNAVSAMCRQALDGIDILTGKKLPPEGVDPVFIGKSFAMVSNVKPRPHEAARLAAEAEERRRAERARAVRDLEAKIMKEPRLYAAASRHNPARKEAALAAILPDLWPDFERIMRGLGLIPAVAPWRLSRQGDLLGRDVEARPAGKDPDWISIDDLVASCSAA